jgi:hypothetical protein
MTRITADADLRSKLLNFSRDLEICDEEGRVMARVQCSAPWNDPDNWEQLTPDITDEEWERIRQTKDYGVTTQELLDHLKRRG